MKVEIYVSNVASEPPWIVKLGEGKTAVTFPVNTLGELCAIRDGLAREISFLSTSALHLRGRCDHEPSSSIGHPWCERCGTYLWPPEAQ